MTGWGARPAASPSTSASGVWRGEQKALGFGRRRKRELRKRREVKRSPSRDRPNVSVPWLRGMRLREVGSCPWSHSKSRSRDSKPEAPSKDKRLISRRHPRPEHGLWSPPCSPSLKSRTPGTWEPDLAAEDPDAGGRGVVPRQCPRRGPCGVVGAARPESHGLQTQRGHSQSESRGRSPAEVGTDPRGSDMCGLPLPRLLSRRAPSAHASRGPGPGRAFYRHRLALPSGRFSEVGSPRTPTLVWTIAKLGEVI